MTRTLLTLTAVLVTLATGAVDADASHSSRERSRAAAVVDGWYRHYLHRPVDPAGIHCWVPHVLQCADLCTVEAMILSSEEYFRRGGYCPRAFVVNLYRDICGDLHPTPREVGYWVSELERSGCRQTVALRFIHEHRRPARVARTYVPIPEPVIVPTVVPAYRVPAYAPPYRPSTSFNFNLRAR
jgi:hypothetical protein